MQRNKGFTLIEIIIALVILGVIVIIGIQVPNRLINHHKDMESDSDIYSDVLMLNESLGKDLMRIVDSDDIKINLSGNQINNIEISLNIDVSSNDSPYGIRTITNTYIFKDDGIYRYSDDGDKTSSKQITKKQFYNFSADEFKDNLLVLGTKNKPLLKYSLIGNSLQQ